MRDDYTKRVIKEKHYDEHDMTVMDTHLSSGVLKSRDIGITSKSALAAPNSYTIPEIKQVVNSEQPAIEEKISDAHKI